jgi:hypothetical protein
MPVTVEEEVVLLYALYTCGRKPSKARATDFIMSNHLMKEREGDLDVVSTRESRVVNRIAWTRENLKRNGELSMPDHGFWAITQKGIERIERIAMRSLKWEEPGDEASARQHDIRYDRISGELLKRLKSLGAELMQRQQKRSEQTDAQKTGSPDVPPASIG